MRERDAGVTVVAERHRSVTLGALIRRMRSEVGRVEEVFDGIQQGSDRSAVRNAVGKSA
jgi:hypothetical protein